MFCKYKYELISEHWWVVVTYARLGSSGIISFTQEFKKRWFSQFGITTAWDWLNSRISSPYEFTKVCELMLLHFSNHKFQRIMFSVDPLARTRNPAFDLKSRKSWNVSGWRPGGHLLAIHIISPVVQEQIFYLDKKSPAPTSALVSVNFRLAFVSAGPVTFAHHRQPRQYPSLHWNQIQSQNPFGSMLSSSSCRNKKTVGVANNN